MSKNGRPKGRRGSRALCQQRERICWEMTIRGYSEEEIAQRLDQEGLGVLQAPGIQAAVIRRGQKVAEEYRENHEWIIGQQVERLQFLYTTSMEAYRLSLRDSRTTTITTGRIHVTRSGEVIEIPEQTVVAVDQRDGNPTLLRTAMDAMSDIRKILGLDAPKRTDVTSDNQPLKAYIGINLERV